MVAINSVCVLQPPLDSHRKKRMRQIKKMQQRGLLDPESEDPFALFVASTDIRYSYYSETHKILGNTFGMCVLQVCWHLTSRAHGILLVVDHYTSKSQDEQHMSKRSPARVEANGLHLLPLHRILKP